MAKTTFYRLARLPGYLILSYGSDVVISFDREHRPFHAFLSGTTYRIGLDGQVIEVHGGGPDSFPTSTQLSSKQRSQLFDRMRGFLKEMLEASDARFSVLNEEFLDAPDARDEVRQILEIIDPKILRLQWEKFKNLYGSVPILPPDCYRSLLVQLTHGCAYNQCRFCSLYRDRNFHIRSPEELEKHLQAVLDFQRSAMDRWTSVFLGEANALAIPQAQLMPMLKKLHWVFKEEGYEDIIKTFYSFTDATKSTRQEAEYMELKELGLKRVHMGLETGCWELRQKLNKPGDAKTTYEKIQNLKKAGIGVGIIILAGAGGREWADRHTKETLDTISKYAFSKDDIVYVSPLRVRSDSTYPLWQETNTIQPLGEEETWLQAHYLIGQLRRFFSSGYPKVAIYDIDRFVY